MSKFSITIESFILIAAVWLTYVKLSFLGLFQIVAFSENVFFPYSILNQPILIISLTYSSQCSLWAGLMIKIIFILFLSWKLFLSPSITMGSFLVYLKCIYFLRFSFFPAILKIFSNLWCEILFLPPCLEFMFLLFSLCLNILCISFIF